VHADPGLHREAGIDFLQMGGGVLRLLVVAGPGVGGEEAPSSASVSRTSLRAHWNLTPSRGPTAAAIFSASPAAAAISRWSLSLASKRFRFNDIPASTNVDLAQQVWVRENGSMTPEELVPRVSKRG
jgi:hypothetical protein